MVASLQGSESQDFPLICHRPVRVRCETVSALAWLHQQIKQKLTQMWTQWNPGSFRKLHKHDSITDFKVLWSVLWKIDKRTKWQTSESNTWKSSSFSKTPNLTCSASSQQGSKVLHESEWSRVSCTALCTVPPSSVPPWLWHYTANTPGSGLKVPMPPTVTCSSTIPNSASSGVIREGLACSDLTPKPQRAKLN